MSKTKRKQTFRSLRLLPLKDSLAPKTRTLTRTPWERSEQDKGDAGKKKADGEKKPIAVVLKIDMHCQGCVTKIRKSLLSLPGVETVSVDLAQNKVTANGIVDPLTIKEKLQNRTKKKVELISPQPKKGENQENKKKKPEEDKKQEKKPKEPPVTTTVLKLSFHCHGCTERIRKLISKAKGVHDFTMDDQKEQVTVKGTVDVKLLIEDLKEKLKRPVSIVPPKKEKDGGENGGGGNGKKNKKKEEEEGEGESDQMRKLIQSGVDHGGYGYWYGPAYPAAPVHAPQLFSDENPNACAVM